MIHCFSILFNILTSNLYIGIGDRWSSYWSVFLDRVLTLPTWCRVLLVPTLSVMFSEPHQCRGFHLLNRNVCPFCPPNNSDIHYITETLLKTLHTTRNRFQCVYLRFLCVYAMLIFFFFKYKKEALESLICNEMMMRLYFLVGVANEARREKIAKNMEFLILKEI